MLVTIVILGLLIVSLIQAQQGLLDSLRLGAPAGENAVITWVMPGAIPWDAGLRPGMVVRPVAPPAGTLAAFAVGGPDEPIVAVRRAWAAELDAVFVLLGLEFFAAGLLVFVRAEDRRGAKRFLVLASALAGVFVVAPASAVGAAWGTGVAWAATVGAAVAAVVFFFDLPVRRWLTFRSLLLGAAVPLVALYLVAVTTMPEIYRVVSALGILYLGTAAGASILALVLPFLTGAPVAERRLRPIAIAAGGAFGLFALTALVPFLVLGQFLVSPAIGVLHWGVLPIGFGWAILRYRFMGVHLWNWTVLRTVFDTVDDPIFVLDHTGRTVAASRAAFSLLGGPATAPTRTQLAQVPGVADAAARVLAGRTIRDEGVAFVGPAGDRRRMSVAGTPVLDERGQTDLAVLVYHDITERMRVEDRLRESEARYRRLAENAPDVIFRYEVRPEPRFDYVNGSVEKLFGYAPEAFYRQPRATLQALLDQELPSMSDLYNQNQEPVVVRCRHRDGRIIWTELRLVPVSDADGLLAVEGIVRDITERKLVEARLVRAEKLEMAGIVAGQVAHDFNNLLAPLAGYPDMIRDQLPEDHPAIELCDLMVQAADQMASINEDLLALGRRAHFNSAPTDLNGLIQQAVAHVEAEHQRRFKFALHLDPDLPAFLGSGPQVGRVITNLIANARTAMGDAGTLTIRTGPAQFGEPGDHGIALAAGAYVRLDIVDTGCGIAAEIQDKVFDAFFTTWRTANRRSLGIGLAIAQRIVADHHGAIAFATEVGVGTTFTVYLPATAERPVEEPSRDLPRGHETILVVDDDVVQRGVVRRLLSSLGYEVRTVSSGEQAIAFLAEQSVDLLILDMIMPGGLDGADTYRRIIAARPGLPAIVVSGYAESARVREVQALGAGPYLRKPVKRPILAQAVRGELDRARRGPSSGR